MKALFLFIASLIGFGNFASAQPDTTVFFVSPTGKSKNPGNKSQPFATAQQARDAIRKHRANHPENCYTVYFQSGRYFFQQSFELTAVDSGRLDCPVRFAAVPGDTVIFHGGRMIDPVLFKPVSAVEVLERLPEKSRGKILEINLKKLGISNFGTLKQHGFGLIPEPAPLELFINDERLPLARYPNSGKLLIGKIHDPGSVPRQGDFSNRGARFEYTDARAKRWVNARDAWLHGRFSFGFNDDHLQIAAIDTVAQTITTAQAHLYGLFPGIGVDTTKWYEMAGHSLRGYFAYNLLEEMDKPGEWFLDRESGMLYLYPPDNFSRAKIEISLSENPLVKLLNTAHIVFENIHFETSRGMGVYLENTHNFTIANCHFSKLGTVAISTGQALQNNRQGYGKDKDPLLDDWRSTSFHHIQIQNCQITNTGTGGIILAGGDRQQLLPSENVISHCNFARTDQVNFTYAPAIKIFGVGTKISDCNFSDIRHMAIGLHGNGHLIEKNRFERICTDADDMGAIYLGRDPSARGTVIQHNHFRDILPIDEDSQVAAVFLDDGVGGIEIGHNYFERVGSQGDKELFGAIAIHGGHGNTVHHNVFQDCEVVIGNNYWQEARWQNFLKSPIIRERIFEQVNVSSPVYREKYPELWDYVSGCGPRLNKIAENILINSNMVLNGMGEFFFNHTETPDRIEFALKKIEFLKN